MRIASVGLAVAAVVAGIAAFVTGVPATLALSFALASLGLELLRPRRAGAAELDEIQQELTRAQS